LVMAAVHSKVTCIYTRVDSDIALIERTKNTVIIPMQDKKVKVSCTEQKKRSDEETASGKAMLVEERDKKKKRY